MAELSTREPNRTHPLIIIAATMVILTCLVAVAAMTGVVPFKRSTELEVSTAPAPDTASASKSALAPSAPDRTVTRNSSTARKPAATGTTAPTAGAGAVGSGAPQTAAAAPQRCDNCGTVVAVRTIKKQGDASMIGPAAGALLGGVLGNQIGSGSGRTIATVVGAGAGAVAGTEIERRTVRATTSYVIDVRMEDGSIRHFSSPTAPAVHAGAKVKVVDGKLMHG